jgi:protocatechuate 3,4-dioxygenase alpha subunit
MSTDWERYGIAPQRSALPEPTGPTPSQTVGPYYEIGMSWMGAEGEQLVPPDSPGAIRLGGRVLDGNGDPVPDAVLELWHPEVGWGRSLVDATGAYRFSVAAVPCYALNVFARGTLQRLATRVYLPPADDGDELLAGLEPDRRATLVAVEADGGLRHDIRLQGEGETVFLVW